MEAVKAYYDGRVFTPEGPVKLAKNTTVILSFQADGRNAEHLSWNEIPRVKAKSGRNSLEILQEDREERV
ncbi:hypothetical protein AGMMS49587_10740 [Spirochaetia bacterium]|nr:hypothetical protein AGMMS49587_10740 [Spirochaetia bacterium]